MRKSDYKNALKNPTQHVRGPRGYALFGLPFEQLPYGRGMRLGCDPPQGTAHESLHILRDVARNADLAFWWNDIGKAWMRAGGRRMGFAPGYLASHGWKYIGVSPDVARRPNSAAA